MSLDPEQRAFLLGAKLRALATNLGLPCAGDPVALGGGSAILDDGTIVVLAGEDAPERSLGQTLLLAARHDFDRLVLFLDDADAASVAARRATALHPVPEVYVVVDDGSEVAEPAEALVPVEPPPAPDGFEDLCRGAGVDPIV
ncbi:MAG: hypothetical protein ABGX79_06085, partial [Acidimicrobiales bacterium]